MKICIFTDAYPPYINGVATSTYNLVQSLKQHGHDVLVVAPQPGDGPTYVEDGVIYMRGVELKSFYGYRLTGIFSNKVFKMVKEFKPDVVHIQTDFTIGQFGRLAIRRLKSAATVYTYHTSYEDYTYYVAKGLADRMAKRFVRQYAKNNAKYMTEYITPSDKTKDYMRQSGSDAYINVIPTGLDFSIFKNNGDDIERIKEFKEQHNIDDETKVFLVLGRLAKEKSIEVSIQGYHEFRQKYPEIKSKMIVVGNGPARGELQNLSIELGEVGNIEFIGAVPASEVPFYYHLADIYTSASLTETQGLTFMESMASGTIVLARFDTQLTDTILDNESGFFFSSVENFADKAYRILTLSNEEVIAIKNKAYEVVDAYSLDKFYENIIRVYKRAVRKKW